MIDNHPGQCSGYIICFDSNGKERGCCTWRSDILVFGSDSSADIVVKSSFIKPNHCKLERLSNKRVKLFNLHPDGKTSVNNNRIHTWCYLNHGSIISLANQRFLFRFPQGSPWVQSQTPEPTQLRTDLPRVLPTKNALKEIKMNSPLTKVKIMSGNTPIKVVSPVNKLIPLKRVLGTSERYASTPPRPKDKKINVRVSNYRGGEFNTSVYATPHLSSTPFMERNQRNLSSYCSPLKNIDATNESAYFDVTENPGNRSLSGSSVFDVRRQSKCVKWGPRLSPEEFSKVMPPSTPVKKGSTPLSHVRKFVVVKSKSNEIVEVDANGKLIQSRPSAISSAVIEGKLPSSSRKLFKEHLGEIVEKESSSLTKEILINDAPVIFASAKVTTPENADKIKMRSKSVDLNNKNGKKFRNPSLTGEANVMDHVINKIRSTRLHNNSLSESLIINPSTSGKESLGSIMDASIKSRASNFSRKSIPSKSYMRETCASRSRSQSNENSKRLSRRLSRQSVVPSRLLSPLATKNNESTQIIETSVMFNESENLSITRSSVGNNSRQSRNRSKRSITALSNTNNAYLEGVEESKLDGMNLSSAFESPNVEKERSSRRSLSENNNSEQVDQDNSFLFKKSIGRISSASSNKKELEKDMKKIVRVSSNNKSRGKSSDLQNTSFRSELANSIIVQVDDDFDQECPLTIDSVEENVNRENSNKKKRKSKKSSQDISALDKSGRQSRKSTPKAAVMQRRKSEMSLLSSERPKKISRGNKKSLSNLNLMSDTVDLTGNVSDEQDVIELEADQSKASSRRGRRSSIDQVASPKQGVNKSTASRMASPEMNREQPNKSKIASPQLDRSKLASPDVKKSKIASPESRQSRISSPEIEKSTGSLSLGRKSRIASPEVIRKSNIASAEKNASRITSPIARTSKIASPEANKSKIASPEARKSRIASPEINKSRIASPEARKLKVASADKNASRITSPVARTSKIASPEANKSRIASPEARKSRIASPEANKSRIASPEANKSKVALAEKNASRITSPIARKSKIASPEARKSRIASPEANKSRIASPEARKSRITSPEIGSRVNSSDMNRSRIASPVISRSKISSPVTKSRVASPDFNTSKIASPELSKLGFSSPKINKSRIASPEASTSRLNNSSSAIHLSEVNVVVNSANIDIAPDVLASKVSTPVIKGRRGRKVAAPSLSPVNRKSNTLSQTSTEPPKSGVLGRRTKNPVIEVDESPLNSPNKSGRLPEKSILVSNDESSSFKKTSKKSVSIKSPAIGSLKKSIVRTATPGRPSLSKKSDKKTSPVIKSATRSTRERKPTTKMLENIASETPSVVQENKRSTRKRKVEPEVVEIVEPKTKKSTRKTSKKAEVEEDVVITQTTTAKRGLENSIEETPQKRSRRTAKTKTEAVSTVKKGKKSEVVEVIDIPDEPPKSTTKRTRRAVKIDDTVASVKKTTRSKPVKNSVVEVEDTVEVVPKSTNTRAKRTIVIVDEESATTKKPAKKTQKDEAKTSVKKTKSVNPIPQEQMDETTSEPVVETKAPVKRSTRQKDKSPTAGEEPVVTKRSTRSRK